MRKTYGTVQTLTSNRSPNAKPVAPASYVGQLLLETTSGTYYQALTAGVNATWEAVFIGTEAELSSTYSPIEASLLARFAPAATDPVPAVMSSPPTIDHGADPFTTSRQVSPAGFDKDGLVSLLGHRGTFNTSSGVLGAGGNFAGLDFWLDDNLLRFTLTSNSALGVSVWVWIDGLPATAAPEQIVVASGATVATNVTFASRARRRVTIYTGGASGWTGLYIHLDGMTVSASPLPRVAFVGDSFWGGSTPSPILQASGMTIARQLGVDPLIASSGGTGYVAGGANTYGSASRVSSVQAFQPELIIMSGSVNDGGLSGVQAAATAAYNAYAAACPNVPIIVFGPQPADSTSTIGASRAANGLAVKTAALSASNVITYFDMVGTSDGVTPSTFATFTVQNNGDKVAYQGSVYEWLGGNAANGGPYTPLNSNRWRQLTWLYTGTGSVGAPAGNGSRDLFLGAAGDAIHPSVAGSNALATVQSAKIREALTKESV